MADWLDKYRVTEQLGHEIMELINERNTLKRTGSNISKTQSSIRVQLSSYSGNLQILKDMLLQLSSSYTITQQELQRRQNQLDILISKEKQLKQAFNPTQSNDRTGLFNNSTFGATSRDPLGSPSHDQDSDMSSGQFFQRQQEVYKDQDAGLEALSKVIQRQKLMGETIGDEINYQNDLIDDVTDGVDRVHSKVERTEKHVKKVTKKSGSCAMIIVIILLLLAIVIIAIY